MNINSPVIIGGVGGSGTRLFASILQECNFYIGNKLNIALDNEWFGRLMLLEHPKLINDRQIKNTRLKLWYNKITHNNKLASKRLAVFKLLMNSDKKIEEKKFYKNFQLFNLKEKNEIISKEIYNKQLPDEIDTKLWGWKQPNSYLFLKPLKEHFPKMKYIHTIRNGLDMVYSKNQNQFKKHKHLYNIPNKDIPATRLEFWLKANEKVIPEAKSLLKDDFFLLNFDNFVLNKKEEMKKLLSFLKIQVSEENFNNLLKLVKTPSSINRYKKNGVRHFSKEQIKRVNNLGFKA